MAPGGHPARRGGHRQRRNVVPVLRHRRQAYHIWYRRYQAEGIDGLRTRSKRPKTSPNATQVEIAGEIIYLRKNYHFGPEKITMYLKPYHDVMISKSGVWRILKRLDMGRLPASQRARGYPSPPGPIPGAAAPGAMQNPSPPLRPAPRCQPRRHRRQDRHPENLTAPLPRWRRSGGYPCLTARPGDRRDHRLPDLSPTPEHRGTGREAGSCRHQSSPGRPDAQSATSRRPQTQEQPVRPVRRAAHQRRCHCGASTDASFVGADSDGRTFVIDEVTPGVQRR